MWADHFEVLGAPSENSNFDNDFFSRVTRSVHETLVSYSNDPSGILCEPLKYEEISYVSSNLKSGVSSVEIDYEHIGRAGPTLWKILFHLHQNFFENSSVCDSLLRGVILPLFKVKGCESLLTKTITGVSLSFLLFAKFTKWCFSTDLNIMWNKMVYFRSRSLDLKRE